MWAAESLYSTIKKQNKHLEEYEVRPVKGQGYTAASTNNTGTAFASSKPCNQSLDGLQTTLLNEPDMIWKSDTEVQSSFYHWLNYERCCEVLSSVCASSQAAL